eukprot:TRINITY_DN25498_c0_g1_i1.p1 TRINITY_DN25498_c0_g1~~TRINITY_DN25498_c0_g1_i1.p1  ORF type:complete len:1464 (+),score=202.85 TRINITY_DN25498_c0_g1_i1:33-4394(+)
MGNQLAGVSAEVNIADLKCDGLTAISPLGGGKGRLLKAVHCGSQDGDVVVKVYLKRDGSDTGIVKKAEEKLQGVDDVIHKHIVKLYECGSRVSNICGYSKVVSGDQAAYAIRPYFYHSLYERMVTRPFLSPIGKRWIAFQLLKAVAELHSIKVPHGDLKAENVMTTSYGWLYLVDIAPFKPTYLRSDNPADFSFFFDAGENRHCYLAPERFDTEKAEKGGNEPVTEKMDVFAAGCIIAQLFMDGEVLFTLSDLLGYKKGSYDPFATLDMRIPDEAVRDLLKHMLQQDESKRFSARMYLATWTPLVFSHYFEVFYTNIIGGLVGMNPDQRLHTLWSRFDDIVDLIRALPNNGPLPTTAAAPVDQDQTSEPVYSCTSGKSEEIVDRHVRDGVTLLSMVACANIRHAKITESRVMGLRIFDRMAEHVDDSTRLHSLLPYTVALLADPSPLVRAKAIQTIAVVVGRVRSFQPSDALLFEEYLLKYLKDIPNPARERDQFVRAVFAESLPEIATHAKRFLETRQLIGRASHTADGQHTGGYDLDVSNLHDTFMGIVQEITTDDAVFVRRSFLKDITRLCEFFGVARTNDFILPSLTTFLNTTDPQLRRIVYQKLVEVALFLGSTSLQQFILPLILQALNDTEEYLVVEVVRGLADLCVAGLFSRDSVVECVKQIVPLVLHPNTWIRNAAIGFVDAANRQLTQVDMLCYFMPILKPYLRYVVLSADANTLKDALFPPVTRAGFDRAVRNAINPNERSGANLQSRAKPIAAPDRKATPKPSPGSNSMRSRTPSTGISISPESLALAPELCTSAMFSGNSIATTALEAPRLRAISRTSSTSSFHEPDDSPSPEEYLHGSAAGAHKQLQDLIKTPPGSPGHRKKAEWEVDHAACADDARLLLMDDFIQRYASKRREATRDTRDESENQMTKTETTFHTRVGNPQSIAQKAMNAALHKETPPLESSAISFKPTSRHAKRLAFSAPPPVAVTNMSFARMELPPIQAPPDEAETADADVPETQLDKKKVIQPISPNNNSVDRSPTYIPAPSDNFLTRVRPYVPLLCQSSEHTASITDTSVSDIEASFLTASLDGTVKYWDLNRLDVDSILLSRETYAVPGVTSVCMLAPTTSGYRAAVGAQRGKFQLIDLKTKASLIELQLSRDTPEACNVTCIRRITRSEIVLCGSNSGRVSAIDTRVGADVWNGGIEPRNGPITSLVVGDEQSKGDGVWMVTSTLRGFVTLWDLRFRIPVETWQYPQEPSAIYALSLSQKQPTVLVAANNNEVGRLNLETQRLTAVYKAFPTHAPIANTTRSRSDSSIKNTFLAAQNTPTSTNAHSVRAICGFRDSNWFITGGTDRKIRFWNTANACQSYVVSGLDTNEQQPKFDERKTGLVTEVLEEPYRLPEDEKKFKGQNTPLSRPSLGHKDCITSLCLVRPLASTTTPLLCSCSRDGVVKVWHNRADKQ